MKVSFDRILDSFYKITVLRECQFTGLSRILSRVQTNKFVAVYGRLSELHLITG